MKWSELIEQNSEKIAEMMVETYRYVEGMPDALEEGIILSDNGIVTRAGSIKPESYVSVRIDKNNRLIDRIAPWRLDYDLEKLLAGSDNDAWILDDYVAYKKETDNKNITIVEFMYANHYDILNHWHNTMVEIEVDKFKTQTDQRIAAIIERYRVAEADETAKDD